jgi:hypothetical protein
MINKKRIALFPAILKTWKLEWNLLDEDEFAKNSYLTVSELR